MIARLRAAQRTDISSLDSAKATSSSDGGTIAEDGTLIVSDANNRVWAITSNSCDGQSPVLHRPADLRADNIVDFIDFAVLAQSWRYCTDPLNPTLCAAGIAKYGLYAPGDVDRDAYINIWDLNALVDEWLTQSEFE